MRRIGVASLDEMLTGRLVRWRPDEGFGFVARDDGGEDLFCHVTEIMNSDGSNVVVPSRVKFWLSKTLRHGKAFATDVEFV